MYRRDHCTTNQYKPTVPKLFLTVSQLVIVMSMLYCVIGRDAECRLGLSFISQISYLLEFILPTYCQSPHRLRAVLHWDCRHRPELQLRRPDAPESELVSHPRQTV